MPIRYKNLTLAIMMSKRKQMLRYGLQVTKHKLNNMMVPVSDKKAIILYKKSIGDITVYTSQK